MKNTYGHLLYMLASLVIISHSSGLIADEHIVPQNGQDKQLEESDDAVVSFSSAYFERFQPQTALEMVQQLPGFQLDNSTNDTRGFGGAAGNLLINDRRPSAKQDVPSTILSRIPSGIVERIELIRGQARGIDLRGQSVMVNVIIKTDSPAAVRWEANVRKSFEHGPLVPDLSVSLTDSLLGLEYNTGFTIRKTAFGRFGLDKVFDGSGNLIENRHDSRENRLPYLNTNLGAQKYFGETLVKFNSIFTIDNFNQFLESDRVPVELSIDPRDEFFDSKTHRTKLEIGADAEREIINNLKGKAIMLFYYEDENSFQSQRVLNSFDVQTRFRVSDKDAITEEIIGRVEFDWTGINQHLIQANFEGAFNTLDGSLEQTLDIGAGPVIVDVPGADSVVDEMRWDVLVTDTITLGQYELDLGIGAETSTISQIGDATQERSFTYIKPRIALSHTTQEGHQTRFRLAREASQLDLNDFVSATVLEDNDVALGNPDLRPDTTWITELGHERRFGRNGSIKLTLFHHWITDVQDLLPLSANFEAPGNIGDGRRWGLEVEGTIPLEWLGLAGAKLDIKARLQDSTVVDPVTGINRELSSVSGHGPLSYDVDNSYAYDIRYRQDFSSSRVSWGWSVISRADRPLYKVNELDIFDEGASVLTFIETSRWLGVKIKLSWENILDFTESRQRTVYVGERDLSPVDFKEVRARTRGSHAYFIVSGTF